MASRFVYYTRIRRGEEDRDDERVWVYAPYEKPQWVQVKRKDIPYYMWYLHSKSIVLPMLSPVHYRRMQDKLTSSKHNLVYLGGAWREPDETIEGEEKTVAEVFMETVPAVHTDRHWKGTNLPGDQEDRQAILTEPVVEEEDRPVLLTEPVVDEEGDMASTPVEEEKEDFEVPPQDDPPPVAHPPGIFAQSQERASCALYAINNMLQSEVLFDGSIRKERKDILEKCSGGLYNLFFYAVKVYAGTMGVVEDANVEASVVDINDEDLWIALDGLGLAKLKEGYYGSAPCLLFLQDMGFGVEEVVFERLTVSKEARLKDLASLNEKAKAQDFLGALVFGGNHVVAVTRFAGECTGLTYIDSLGPVVSCYRQGETFSEVVSDAYTKDLSSLQGVVLVTYQLGAKDTGTVRAYRLHRESQKCKFRFSLKEKHRGFELLRFGVKCLTNNPFVVNKAPASEVRSRWVWRLTSGGVQYNVYRRAIDIYSERNDKKITKVGDLSNETEEKIVEETNLFYVFIQTLVLATEGKYVIVVGFEGLNTADSSYVGSLFWRDDEQVIAISNALHSTVPDYKKLVLEAGCQGSSLTAVPLSGILDPSWYEPPYCIDNIGEIPGTGCLVSFFIK